METKKYINTVVINGSKYSNIIEAFNYSEALKIQRERKSKSRNQFIGRLQIL
jgi:hypothetical protein